MKQIASRYRLPFNGLLGVISQKIELFITTAVRTSDPTRRYIPEDRRTLHNHRRGNLRSYTRYIPEDRRTLHNHRCENLRSYRAIYPRR
jgi:hypothetical protein